MRAFAVVALVAGCGFKVSPGTGVDGGTTDDGAVDDALVDMMIDADPTADTDGDGDLDPDDNCPTVPNGDQRDFDTDQRGDACDRCPHIEDTTDPDGDGDGVGNECDPRRNVGGDTRQRWTSFHAPTEINGWSSIGSWTVNTGVAPTSSMFLSALHPTTPTGELGAATMIEIQNTFDNNDTAGICMADSFNGNEYYCCALFGANGGIDLRVDNRWSDGSDRNDTEWMGSTTVGTRIVISGAILDEETRCVYHEVGTNTRMTTMGSRGSNTPSGGVTLYTDDVIARFRYLFVVSVGP
jgi:hypothetical protein